MTALGSWHLLQYCISTCQDEKSIWKVYPKWTSVLTSPMKGQVLIHLGFCSNLPNLFQSHYIAFSLLCSSSLRPQPYGYLLDMKYIYSHTGIQNQYSSEFNASPFQLQFQAFSCLLKDRYYPSHAISSSSCISVSFQVKKHWNVRYVKDFCFFLNHILPCRLLLWKNI